MATLHDVQAALQEAVKTATTGLTLNSTPIPVDVGIGWPPINVLQDTVRNGRGTIAVYDQKIGRNTTRWLPFSYEPTVIVPTLTSAVSHGTIELGGVETITLGGAVTPGDAVSAVLINTHPTPFDSQGDALPYQPGAQVVIGAAGAPTDTPTTMATALATAVNGDTLLSTWVHATSAGPVVTLTALSGKGPLLLASHTGNGATGFREIGRRERHFQIACWTGSEELRQVVTDPIDAMLAEAELNFGLALPDGSMGRLLNQVDYYIEDGTLQDALRRDFILTIDYPVTVKDQLFAILAPELIQAVEGI